MSSAPPPSRVSPPPDCTAGFGQRTSRFLRAGQLVTAVDYLQANRRRAVIMQDVARAIADVDAVMFTSLTLDSRSSLNPVMSLTGHPSIAVPNGFRSNGSPTGVMFSGHLYREGDVIALAKAWQDAAEPIGHPPLFASDRLSGRIRDKLGAVRAFFSTVCAVAIGAALMSSVTRGQTRPTLSTAGARLRHGRCAGHRAHPRARDRRHRRAGARGSDAGHDRDGVIAAHRQLRRPRPVPAGAHDDRPRTGKSVIPGLVMVHEHLYYPTGPGVYGQLGESFSRLYLAGGVTTMRTGGNVNGFMDLNMKRLVEAGPEAGPGDRRDGAVPERPEHVHPDAHAEGPGRRAPAGAVLGRRGRDVVQGLHADHARRAGGRDRRSAQAAASRSPATCARSPTRKRPTSASTTSSTASSPPPTSSPTSSRTCARARASGSRRSPRSTRTARRSRRWSRR